MIAILLRRYAPFNGGAFYVCNWPEDACQKYQPGYICSMNFATMPVTIVLSGLAIVLIGVLLYRLSQEIKKRLQAEEKRKALELKLNAIELEAIQYKLNPHLFKNILNSIQSHAYQTYYALDKLSHVLDYILYESDNKLVSLKQEIEFALSLIEINRLKVSPLFNLRIKNKIDPANPLYEQELIAPLITTGLIENAFKHADLQSDNAFIAISFELTNDSFELTVSNRISMQPALKKERGGFGKESLQKRLSVVYRDNYRLDQFTEDGVYISHLKINLVEHKTQMHTAG